MNAVELLADGGLRMENGDGVADALAVLAARVELGAGYCLRSFFRLLQSHPVLARLNGFYPEYLGRYPSWPAQGCEPAGLAALVLARTVEIIGHPGPPRLEIYTTFRGRDSTGADMEVKSYPVETLLDVPVVLGPLTHVVFGDRMDELVFETVFNLFEFQDSIGWQLGFHGTPTECALRR